MVRVNVVEKPAVDLEDDLELARNEEAHPLDRPTLERLGKQSVVGVGERRARDIPRFVPTEMRFVEQDAHELRNGEGRVRVVELNGGLLGQKTPIGIRFPKPADRVGQRTGDEKIFLHEPQGLPLLRVVVRIENAGEQFGVEPFRNRGHEIAAAELLKIERMSRGGAPQTQRVDRLAAVADHRPIIGDADERRGLVRNHAQLAFAQFKRAAEGHWHAFRRPHDLPGIRMSEPIVRALLLPAVLNFLLKDAVLIAQAIAHRGQLHRGHRVEETGGETAETAIAQASVRLLVEDLPPLAAIAFETRSDDRIEQEIHDIVAKRTADKKLDRDVIDPLRILARIGLMGAQPTVGKNVSDRARGGLVPLASVGGLRLDNVVVFQVSFVQGVGRAREQGCADRVALQDGRGVGRTLDRRRLRAPVELMHVVHRSGPPAEKGYC